ncbi:MAG TPA: BrnA antitoxin family protein [Casimicrobium huifangae]|uniref:BrnA antitoxin family protein n=1 Tax=Casimicrobium huifangae TaxID=2591109 RepID=UPI002CEBC81C|nr:BrnA antitoxin family protein [Casimicrobium huifangae]HQA35240.1 BrnA antitoxin family protein [Casimicrobium huifangae]HQD66461.1 BrnA antitoxin family protein [Casimicrobium huifangae]
MKSASSLSAKPRAAKPTSTTVKSRSKTDWARLSNASATATPTDEHPEVAMRRVVRGVVRRGLQPIPTKTAISLRVDQDVLEWFKAQGDGYQTRINAVLRAFRDASA